MIGIALLPLSALITTLGIEVPPRQVQDGSLQAWHGCWREVTDDALAEAPLLCIFPGADASEALLATITGNVPGPTTTLRVDGVSRPAEEGGCTGTEAAQWSRNGRRIFVRTELDCAGLRRVSTGVIAMITENEWIDVQAAEVGGRHATRTLRYRAVGAADMPAEVRDLLPDTRDLVQEAARLHASAPLELEDVIEASALVAAPALQGLLAASGQGFRLDGRSLVALEQAGVARDVIDVMVALSYPRQFAVQQPERAGEGDRFARSRRGYADDCWDPYLRIYRYGIDCDRYYRYGSRYRYSPWGYDPFGWNYSSPAVVIVRPDPGREPRQPGELVKGGGYKRGSGASGSTAQPRSNRDAGGSAESRPASASGSSSGSSAEPRGTTTSSPPASSAGSSSSGSSSSSTGRTAVPRGGG